MELLFFVMAILGIVSAVAVVCFRNPLHSALSLIAHMVLIAGFFAMLEAHFLAAAQIVVYAGAVMVLVLFVVMLLNIKVEQVKPYGVVPFALGSAAALGFIALFVPPFFRLFSSAPDSISPLRGGAQAMGRILYTEYLLPFEIASVLIIAAIVGAVMVAKRSHHPASTQPRTQSSGQPVAAGGVDGSH
jgi:NADH-quinone oxidoreductase subunit J